MLSKISDEILNGLSSIPSPMYPGRLICTGESQPVFTGQKSSEVFLAACQLEKGRVFVASHDVYLKWVNSQAQPIKPFIDNVKLWLSSRCLSDSDIGDVATTENFSNFKMIKWNGVKLTPKTLEKLLVYIQSGGSLFCGFTPWGYLQSNPTKTLASTCIFKFLKFYTGILLTPDTVFMPAEIIEVAKNNLNHTNIHEALDLIVDDLKHLSNHFHHIHDNLEIVHSESLIEKSQVVEFIDRINDKCQQDLLHVLPNVKKPVKGSTMSLMAAKLIGKFVSLSERKALTAHEFPGDINELTELLQGVELTLGSGFKERVSTGYYLPAGVTLSLQVVSGSVNGWKIRVGAHSDDLFNADYLKRMHDVCNVISLEANVTKLFSPYGGLVFFESPTNCRKIEVILNNVVEAPFYDLTSTESVDNWPKRRHSVGIWAELAGRRIIFTTKSEYVRHLDDPRELLEFWDCVVESHHRLRGSRVENYCRERITSDVQISCGYMHSGYPIMTHLDICEKEHEECIFDVNKLKARGNWGIFHELGHNMQRSEWTFESAVEVTCNLFSVHACQFIVGLRLNQIKFLENVNLAGHLSKKTEWKDFKYALVMFVVMIQNFGWESMYKFLKEYEEDIAAEKKGLPKTDVERVNQWVVRYSRIVARNVKQHFVRFGLIVSDWVDEELCELEDWHSSEF